jgi:hypothetical protein
MLSQLCASLFWCTVHNYTQMSTLHKTRLLWAQALQATYGLPFTGHSHQFRSSLGSWLPNCNKGRWFYSNAQQSLFQRSDIGFVRFATSSVRSSRHQSRRRFYRSSTVKAVPPDAVPTIVHSVPHSDTVVLTGIRPTPPGPPTKVQDPLPSHAHSQNEWLGVDKLDIGPPVKSV